MRKLDVLCVGEALVDFLPDGKGKRVRDVTDWRACSGGSPANVAIGLSRLGAKAAFLGVVGDDEFGAFLRQSLESDGVDVRHLRQTKEGKTGLVFVSIDEDGDRSFAFYRKGAAEFLLNTGDIDRAQLEETRVVHMGTNSLLYPEAREAARLLVRRAREKGCVTSCDPNLRLHVWEKPEILRELIGDLFRHADVVKVAEDEAEFCTGEKDPERAVQAMAAVGVKLGIVTLGGRGAVYVFNGRITQVAAPKVDVVDATGAGDGFVAGLLSRLSEHFRRGETLEAIDPEVLRGHVTFACRVGSAVCTKLGAVAGLPLKSEL